MRLAFIFLFLCFCNLSIGTTWDEPWQNRVIKEADFFVLAKVKSFKEKKGVTLEILKTLGGKPLKRKIKIKNFYLLDICSRSAGHGPEFRFEGVSECYFFIKKNEKGEYCIATPTSGFDYVKDGSVYSSYRHSYHQAMVPIDVYEKTMLAIFNNYHGLPYDKQYIIEYVEKYVSIKPAGFSKDEISTFFAQHVALECVYHLRLKGFYSKLLPFLSDTSNFHNQISAARALVSSNSNECQNELIKVVEDPARNNFVKVICLWTLSEFKPSVLKNQLILLKEKASEESNGFGGNIMDPRVCTKIPNVKTAIEKLVAEL